MSLCDKKRKIQKFPKEFWGMTKKSREKNYNTNNSFHYCNLGRRTENELSNVYCVRNKWVTLDNWDYIYMLQQHRLYKEVTENDAALNIITRTYWLTKLIRFWNLLGFSKLSYFINQANGGKAIVFLYYFYLRVKLNVGQPANPKSSRHAIF